MISNHTSFCKTSAYFLSVEIICPAKETVQSLSKKFFVAFILIKLLFIFFLDDKFFFNSDFFAFDFAFFVVIQLYFSF